MNRAQMRAAALRPDAVPDGHKWCCRCGRVRPLALFWRNKRTPDGLATYCTACLGAAVAESERRHPELRHRAAYHARRKRHGDDLRDVPVGQTRGALGRVVEQRAFEARVAARFGRVA